MQVKAIVFFAADLPEGIICSSIFSIERRMLGQLGYQPALNDNGPESLCVDSAKDHGSCSSRG